MILITNSLVKHVLPCCLTQSSTSPTSHLENDAKQSYLQNCSLQNIPEMPKTGKRTRDVTLFRLQHVRLFTNKAKVKHVGKQKPISFYVQYSMDRSVFKI